MYVGPAPSESSWINMVGPPWVMWSFAEPLKLLPAVVMRMGSRFRPNELSIPFCPSACQRRDAPSACVHTSVDCALVVLPSMFRP